MRPVPRRRPLLAALVLAALAAGAGAGGAVAADGDGGRLEWNDLAAALAESRRAGKPTLVNVVTEWCGWCKRMDKTTYADPAVRDYVVRSFIPARIDAENDRLRVRYEGEVRSHRQFADDFRISRYPTTLFLAADGSLITQLPGYVKPATFLSVLHYVAEGHYKTRTYDEYARDSDPPPAP